MRAMQRGALGFVLSTSFVLSACATGQEGLGQTIGALAAGGLCLALIDRNHQVDCIAAAAAGFVVGGLIGHNLDERDRKRREEALAATLNNDNMWARHQGAGPLSNAALNASPTPAAPPTRTVFTAKQSDWVNPDTQNAGRIEPLRAYVGGSQHNQDCRQYRETYWKQGEPFVEARTVCKDAEGHWV